MNPKTIEDAAKKYLSTHHDRYGRDCGGLYSATDMEETFMAGAKFAESENAKVISKLVDALKSYRASDETNAQGIAKQVLDELNF